MENNLMRAVQLDSYGPPEVLHISHLPIPFPLPDQVLIRVAATSLNGADIAVRSGKLSFLSGKKFPRGAGFDFTGEVISCGNKATTYKPGDMVWGFLSDIKQKNSAAAAEYVVAVEKALSYIPVSLDPIQAASLPGAGSAALGALRDYCKVKKGDRVLIRGAAGGVGVFAVQIATYLGGSVTGLASLENVEKVLQLGAVEAFDYRTTSPNELGRFDVILDTVTKNMADYRSLLNPGGRMVTLNIGSFKDFFSWFFSFVYGSRRIHFVESPPNHELLTTLAKLVDMNIVKPITEKVYSLEEYAKAHQEQENGGGFGKRVITVN